LNEYQLKGMFLCLLIAQTSKLMILYLLLLLLLLLPLMMMIITITMKCYYW